MPILLSFLMVRLRWHFRAVALRCCQCWMIWAVCSIRVVEARPLSHQLGMSEPTADRILPAGRRPAPEPSQAQAQAPEADGQ